MKKRGLFVCLWIVLLLRAPAAPAQSTLPPMLRGVTFEQKLNAQVPPDLKFRDENGRSVRLGDYFGRRPVILTLVYYQCPMLCTYVLNGMVSSLRVLKFSAGKEFTIVTVSFDHRETAGLAAAKKELYIREYGREGAADGWHFLTGDADSIQRLTAAVGFQYKFDAQQNQFAHASGILVLTPEGRLARYFYGVEYPPRDLRLALVEASRNKIGSPIDQILLFCFHYDPSVGRYGPYVLNVVRIGGILTVFSIGALILVMKRKEKQRPRTTKQAPNV